MKNERFFADKGKTFDNSGTLSNVELKRMTKTIGVEMMNELNNSVGGALLVIVALSRRLNKDEAKTLLGHRTFSEALVSSDVNLPADSRTAVFKTKNSILEVYYSTEEDGLFTTVNNVNLNGASIPY